MIIEKSSGEVPEIITNLLKKFGDINHVEFQNFDFENIDFKDIEIKYSSFYNMFFKNVCFSKVDLDNCIFNKVHFYKTDFSNVNLTDVNFCDCIFEHTTFPNTKLLDLLNHYKNRYYGYNKFYDITIINVDNFVYKQLYGSRETVRCVEFNGEKQLQIGHLAAPLDVWLNEEICQHFFETVYRFRFNEKEIKEYFSYIKMFR
jgi:hypothetical protein